LHSVESLLHAGRQELGEMLAATRVAPQGDQNARRTRIAQALGLNAAQLVCGLGFNASLVDYTTAVHFLGFSSFESLAVERNYTLVHDRYRSLSVNNILDIYAFLGNDKARRASWSDLASSRLITIEEQLEETINPILIGGYKLEIRGIYENSLASPAFVRLRLDRNYAVLRDIANECVNMLTSKSISPTDFIRSQGLTPREKSRMVLQGLLEKQTVNDYLAEIGDGEEATSLRKALAAA
jgi:hypothetical protein